MEELAGDVAGASLLTGLITLGIGWWIASRLD
jgi:hypothetical protein